MAEVAEPLNHFSPTAEEAKTAMKTTPETYSGVAVVTIETVERPRSRREPSRMPARMPIRSALGTMTTMTQNMSAPVSARPRQTMSITGCLKTVEKPQSPWSTPQKRGAVAGSVRGSMQRPRMVPSSSVRVQPGMTPSHSP